MPCPPGRMRGSGLMNALFSAMRGGPAAARVAAQDDPLPEIEYAQAEGLRDRMFAPLRRDKGVAAIDVVHAVQELMSPVEYSGLKSEGRMKKALGRLSELHDTVSELKARDTHDLSACNEARSMVVCAEMFFRSSLERKESRGWHIREDYPETDNRNWLKWIVLKDENGRMGVRTEDIPIERYPIRP